MSSIGTRLPWSASVLVITTWPLPSGRACELSRPSAKSLGGSSFKQPELILPAQAIGLELIEQVEHGEVAAKLFAGRGGGEVLGVRLLPVERHPLSWTKRKRLVHARVGLIVHVRSISQAWSTLCSLKPIV